MILGNNRYLILLIALLLSSIVDAQSISNLRSQKINNPNDTIFLDSLAMPNTISIFDANNKVLANSNYTINTQKHFIIIKSQNAKLPLSITYKVFPFNLSSEYYHKKWEKPAENNKENIDFYIYYQKQNENNRAFLGLNNYQKDGSISRAVSVGNSQNLSVMSHMNLQIAGKITPELELIASISDDNIPIQPDGNTQQLQDFDKVFIQLKHKNGQITAGDFEMKNPKSLFLRYHKKAQGANASVNIKINKTQQIKAYGGIALSKGKYARNIIAAIEGNQGPYKLIGSNLETSIIVLSGTERVYIDGKELQRGQNYDYVIDYNTAEISFTPKIPITKDKRIQVEFQYSDRSYARYLANVGFEFTSTKLKIATHYYTETDLKNQPLDQNLSDAQLQLLYGIGDSLHLAISPSVDSIPFNGNEVLYKRVDSLGYSPVYVYSTSADSAFYRLSFSMVGAGKGNYVQIQSLANGRTYKWVAPVSGIPQGDHEPVVLLVTPKKSQIVTSILEYKVFKNTKVTAEIAVSDRDVNLLSPYDDENNTSYAYNIGISNKTFIDKQNNWHIYSKANYEFVDMHFSPIERFRSVEFERDWNTKSLTNSNQQKIEASVALKNSKSALIKYDFQNYRTTNDYNGLKNSFTGNLENKKWKLRSNISYTTTDEKYRRTKFTQHKINIERKLSMLSIGIIEDGEKNNFLKKQSDSLFSNSYQYQQYEAYIKSPSKAKQNIKLHYKLRDDYNANYTSLNKSMRANELGLDYKLLKTKSNRLSIIANYRRLNIIDTNLTKLKPENTSMGRLEHFINAYKGSIRATSFFELGSGMESRKDYAYIEVAAGQGVYSWHDYNNNNVKELNEFEIAVFKDQANYIRIYVPSNDYVKTYNNTFSTSVTLSPSRVWRQSSSKILKTIAHFANQLVYRSSIKTLNSNWKEFANPFYHNISDTSLMNINSSFRNTFYFNRGHSKYGIDYTFLNNKNKILMMNGYQGRSRKEHQLKFRWNINRILLLQLEGYYGQKLSFSDYFKNKEFDIVNQKAVTKISLQPNRVFRISVPLSIENKANSIVYGGQTSQSVKIGLQAKYNVLNKGSWTASVEHINISYSGTTNGPIAFEMLQGFMPGKNYIWMINYQRNLMNNLQLNIMYNGRKNDQTDVIHIGSVQLRAFF